MNAGGLGQTRRPSRSKPRAAEIDSVFSWRGCSRPKFPACGTLGGTMRERCAGGLLDRRHHRVQQTASPKTRAMPSPPPSPRSGGKHDEGQRAQSMTPTRGALDQRRGERQTCRAIPRKAVKMWRAAIPSPYRQCREQAAVAPPDRASAARASWSPKPPRRKGAQHDGHPAPPAARQREVAGGTKNASASSRAAVKFRDHTKRDAGDAAVAHPPQQTSDVRITPAAARPRRHGSRSAHRDSRARARALEV